MDWLPAQWTPREQTKAQKDPGARSQPVAGPWSFTLFRLLSFLRDACTPRGDALSQLVCLSHGQSASHKGSFLVVLSLLLFYLYNNP